MHENCHDQYAADAGDRLAEQLAAVLVQLVFEAQRCGLSLQPFLAGLRRLASEWPSLLTPYIPLLGPCITAAGDSLKTLMSHSVSGVGFLFVFPFFFHLHILVACSVDRLNPPLGSLFAPPFGCPLGSFLAVLSTALLAAVLGSLSAPSWPPHGPLLTLSWLPLGCPSWLPVLAFSQPPLSAGLPHRCNNVTVLASSSCAAFLHADAVLPSCRCLPHHST